MANYKLPPDVADILSRSTIAGNRLTLPPAQLDRKTYEAVNKAIELAGGKWNRSARVHVFTDDPRTKIDAMLGTGVAIDEKNLYQAFYTPDKVAAQVAQVADVAGCIVLEPSAGRGALADACMDAGAERVECIELHSQNAAYLRDRRYEVIEGDFLSLSPPSKAFAFSRIVMNPPFAKNQDVQHVAHALKFLCPGGVLVAVMLDNPGRAVYQDLIWGLRYEVHPLPKGAFHESGTDVGTLMLKIYAADSKRQQDSTGEHRS